EEVAAQHRELADRAAGLRFGDQVQAEDDELKEREHAERAPVLAELLLGEVRDHAERPTSAMKMSSSESGIARSTSSGCASHTSAPATSTADSPGRTRSRRKPSGGASS